MVEKTAVKSTVGEPLIKATLAVMRDVPKSFADGLTTRDLGAPDYDKIVKEHQDFKKVLESLGVTVIMLPPDESKPDSYFPRDTIISYMGHMLAANPGSSSRRGEVEPNIYALGQLGVVVERVTYGKNAFIEGGDVLTFESQHLVVIGMSGNPNNVRTNKAGVDALAKELRAIDTDVTVVAVPHGGSASYPQGVLHLETGLTPLTSKIALQDPHCHIDWENAYYPLSGSRKIAMPPWKIIMLSEAEGYAAHVLPINGAIIIPKGFKTVKALAEAHYDNVIEVDSKEKEKMDGSLRCGTVLHDATTVSQEKAA